MDEQDIQDFFGFILNHCGKAKIPFILNIVEG